ncbi:RES family NAD+ phosphorylase [Rahnella laticis]|uniref:RES family NAD+ phosphorylase n=1 Tax=Rahnella laticis TaxID=2787622 RepID=UPI0018A30A19|nr:RES family NAD+ phosphorylase [Rahnella laticis]MBF7996167.1 RES domain-containing protein [Rahnella laticis]
MKLFRIIQTQHLATAWTGAGAQIYGGRWNPPGRPVVYLTTSISLAILEILVHLQNSMLMRSYTLLSIEVPDTLLDTLEVDELTADWRSPSPPDSTQRQGEAWLAEGEHVGLRVPSVIVPTEYNVLLNPQHPDFAPLLDSAKREPMMFDPRLQ